MKVDGISFPSITNIAGTNKVKAIHKATAQDKDSLAVSDKGQFYQLLMQKVKELPEVRSEKVQGLSDRVARGEYQVNANRIAELMLSDPEKL